MRSPLVLLALLAGCLPPGDADRSAFLPDLPPPTITDLAVVCDAEAGRWELDVVTDAWAGGAALTWTVDGAYVERHNGFRSVRAALDGTRDQLTADVAIVPDFRAARNGLTVFGCRERPSAILAVLDLELQVADCVRVGERIAGVEGVPSCPRVVEVWAPSDTDPSDTDPPDTDAPDP